jgi:3-(3-hydroxy-phenyl)propionate hydroxylase
MGDAAHLMSPFGGRGLNSGVQDVWNLIWKLLLVRAGLAPESLLETYHEERHPAAIENLRLTDDTMRFLVPKPGFALWKRDTILRLSLPFKWMRRYVNAGHMSNPFTYRNSSIVSEDPSVFASSRSIKLTPEQRAALKRFQAGPIAGALAPAVILTDALTNEPVPLLDHFGRGFVVLYFCSDADAGIAALSRVQPELPDLPVALYLLTPQPPAQPVPPGLHVLLDAEGKGATAYNAGTCTLYLVRPDRHIAARRLDCNLSELPALLQHAVGARVMPSTHQTSIGAGTG